MQDVTLFYIAMEKINEMNELADISPKIDNFTLKKTSQLYSFLL